MGKALQIRVSAVTWDEDLPEKLWPRITELAFSVPVQHENRGVLAIVRALDEGLIFMKWSEARKNLMGPDIREAAGLKKELEAALADWQPREANRLSDALEDVLDRMEQRFTT